MSTKGQGLDEDLNTSQRRRGKQYLFAIAIDQYRHSPPLYNCVRDAEKLISVLQQKYQFEATETFTLFNEAATEKNIFDTFKQLVRLVQPEDNLLILYSGHGEFEADIEEGYWIPVDAQLGDFSDYVSNSRIVKYLKALHAHHILLIVDSCFSGTLFTHRNAASRNSVLRLDDIPSRWLLTAGRNEVVSDGKPGDHSPFADNIIYFLEHNRENSLSVADLSDAVLDAVVYNSRQTPRGEPLQDVGHRGGQFFFHRKGFVPTDPTQRPLREEIKPEPATIHPIADTPTTRSSGGSGFWIFAAILIGIGLIALLAGSLFRPAADSPAQLEYDDQIDALEDYRSDDPEQPTEEVIASTPEAVQESPSTPQPTKPVNRITQAWQSAQNLDTEEAYRRFIERFPNSRWVAEAEQQIAGKYRYQLAFGPTLKNNRYLEVHFSNGKAPYHVTIIKPNDERIEKIWDSGEPFRFDLGTVEKGGSGLNVIKVIVADYNFKKKGHVLPVN